MKMKKLFVIIALVIVGLFSCKKEVVLRATEVSSQNIQKLADSPIGGTTNTVDTTKRGDIIEGEMIVK
jgi:hypothetical protein